MLACLYYGFGIRSLEYVLNSTFRKIFATKSFDESMSQLTVYYILAVQFRTSHSVGEKVNF